MDSRKNCVVYCRTSTVRQKETETIKAQVERCKALVDQHGLRVLPYGPRKGWVIDDGVSGTLLAGRAFSRLLDALDEGLCKPDYIVVFSLSRLSRLDKSTKDKAKLHQSHKDNARIKSVLLGAGVKVIDEEGVNDPTGVMYDLKAALSVEEFSLIRSRTTLGKKRRLREGRYARGGRPPYGYKVVPVNGRDRRQGFTLAPHPEEGSRFKQVIGWYLKGGYTFAARKATEAKIPTPMAYTDNRRNKADDWTPTRWSPVTVQNIAKNARAYLGQTEMVFAGEAFTLTYPPLITNEMYQRILRRRKERTLKHRAKFLSTGFLDCSCGAHMHERNSHDRHFARCARRCGHPVREVALSAALWDGTINRLVEIQKTEQTRTANKNQFRERLEQAKQVLASVMADILRLSEMYGHGLDKDTWKARNDVLNESKVQAQNEIETIEREQQEHESRQASQETLEARISKLVYEILTTPHGLEKKRQVLSDLLAGDRVIVSWERNTCVLRFPAFGALKARVHPVNEKASWIRDNRILEVA